MEILQSLYLWLKAGHVIFVIFWMAGLFMLPRYFVYHQESDPGSAEEARWIDREEKLRKIILTPALVLTWVLGVLTALAIGAFSEGWLHAKLTLVLVMTGYHGWLVGQTKKMARGERPLSEKTLRMIGEVPGVLLILIVLLVYLKPF